jgi:hypothetical protein
MFRGLNLAAQPKDLQSRVPDRDILEARCAGGSQADPLDLGEIALPGSFGREPRAPANKAPEDRRDLTRPLTALLALGLGLLGVLYVGKRYTDSHVIVVPATTNEHSVIT